MRPVEPRHAFGQGLDILAEFRQVGARVAPEREHEANHGRAYGEDCDEFRGHGRLPGVGGVLSPPCRLSTYIFTSR